MHWYRGLDAKYKHEKLLFETSASTGLMDSWFGYQVASRQMERAYAERFYTQLLLHRIPPPYLLLPSLTDSALRLAVAYMEVIPSGINFRDRPGAEEVYNLIVEELLRRPL